MFGENNVDKEEYNKLVEDFDTFEVDANKFMYEMEYLFEDEISTKYIITEKDNLVFEAVSIAYNLTDGYVGTQLFTRVSEKGDK